MMNAEFDQYLAECMARLLRGQTAGPWPEDFRLPVADAARRIAFHGISLAIAQSPGAMESWPPALAREVREQAGVQTFWEASHRPAIARLIEALTARGIETVITKGSAMAYSVYDVPALRRRGDTDILVPNASRRQVRKVLRDCGFYPVGDARVFQESWQCETQIGFEPTVDVHWRINTSAVISQMLERGLHFHETIALPRLSPNARGITPIDNLILAAINRSAHLQFGYHVGPELLYEGDRLIWAVDTLLLTADFGPEHWQTLVQRAASTGTSAILGDSLAFAQRTVAVPVPAQVNSALEQTAANAQLAAYLGSSSHAWRLRRDLASCRTIAERARVLRYVVLPSDEFLQARFPEASGWPRPMLLLRRWLEGAGKLLIGKE